MHKLLYAYIIALYLISGVNPAFAYTSTEGYKVYRKNVHSNPERKKRLTNDIKRYRNADNIWDALREEFSLPHYEHHVEVQQRIEWYMSNQDYLLRAATRAAPYLYYILQQTKTHHLPAELALLPVVESGFNPFSRSHMGASGLWQLMPSTATSLGVKQDWWYDGRRDIIASTRAALNYLSYLQDYFNGNWLLAIAAYNTGEGNVQASIRRNTRAHKKTDFWSLPLSRETKSYVPSLLALATIISRPDIYPVYLPPIKNAPYLAQVDIQAPINLKYAATLAGLSHKKLLRLNSGYNRASISAKGPYKLILPIENVAEFTENLSRSPLNHQKVKWVHYKVKPGDSLSSIGKKFRVSIASIYKLNKLKHHKIKNGADLLIPHNSIAANKTPVYLEKLTKKMPFKRPHSRAKKHIAAKSNKGKNQNKTLNLSHNYTLQPGDTIYTVRNKDTLESIAHHYHINKLLIKAANQLTSDKVRHGAQLIIPTHSSPNDFLTAGEKIYMVHKGDTIKNIAQKFHTTPASLRLANLIDGTSLKEGEKLLVPTTHQG